MKKILIVAIAMVMAIGFGSMAQADVMRFDSNGAAAGGTAVFFSSLDWTPGNAISPDSFVAAGTGVNGTTIAPQFELYFQTTLGNFLDAGGNEITNDGGLNSTYEITLMTAFTEITTFAAPGVPISTFSYAPVQTVNYVELFYDDTPDANHLAGTGFNDGVSLMKGIVIPGTGPGQVATGGNFQIDVNPDATLNIEALDGFNTDDYAGILSVTGGGSTRATADMDEASVNSAFLNPSGSVLLLLELLTNTSQIVPFLQQDPGAQFVDLSGGPVIIPSFGDCTAGPGPCEPGLYNLGDLVNGSSGDMNDPNATAWDFQFQVDANSAVRIEAPEPATLLLLGTGLLGAGALGYRRRK